MENEKVLEENFKVIIPDTTQINNENVVLSDDFTQRLENAMKNYDASNRSMSVYLNDSGASETLTPELIDSLGAKPQTDLRKILRINSIVEQAINTDDIIGKVDEIIESNINTECKISYSNANSEDDLVEIKNLINSFNNQIEIENVIRAGISTTFRQGNYIMYLRHPEGNKRKYSIDIYPLGVAEISNYHVGFDPYILIDIDKLVTGLRKNYPKNKKYKPLFYKDIDDEIKNTYPKEVYEAYKNKERYAKLDIRYSYVLRVGNMNKQYGVTPILRALKPASMLQTFDNSDRATSKARKKKIIVQFMEKDFAKSGDQYSKDCYAQQTWNHSNLLAAWKSETVIVTTNPSVRDVKYVESQTAFTDKDTVNTYRNRVYASLGIGFLMESSSSVSTANISLDQLMKTINKISMQLGKGLEKFYRQVLIDNGKDPSLTPNIEVVDCEMMSNAMKLDMASFMYSTLAISRETCFKTIGLDVNDEANKRKHESDIGYKDVFAPYSTAFNTSGNESGRPPSSDDSNKQEYDKDYNKNRKGG